MSKNKDKKQKRFKLPDESVAIVITPFRGENNMMNMGFRFVHNSTIEPDVVEAMALNASLMTAAMALAARDAEFFEFLMNEAAGMFLPPEPKVEDRITSKEDNVIHVDFTSKTKGNA